MTERGAVLGGRYELVERIGQGGMAGVWAARDLTLDREVAVKFLLPRFSDDEQFIARFRQEAQSAASLNHPNIVTVFDTGEQGGLPFIVMELVTGQSLAETLREGPLTEARAIEIASDVCLALEYAHSRGLVHRDVKPGNILLADDGAVKVTDFGIARAISADTVTQTAAVLGTAAYLSPEQAQGLSVDERSDVYSLGVTLYEVLTGTPPFVGDSPVTVAYQHVQEQPTALRDLDDGLSIGIEQVVLRAMAKNPANRYGSVAALREDLLRARDGQTTSAPAVLRMADTRVLPTIPVNDTSRSVGFWVMIGLVAIGAVVALFALLASALGDPTEPRLTVPDVTDQTVPDAERILRGQGLVPRVVEEVFDDDVEAGRVVRQVPAPGTPVSSGAEIRLTESRGVEQVPVPTLSGLDEESAAEVLRARGLLLGTVREEASDTTAAGVVIRSDPREGVDVAKGSAVALVVSSGVETVKVRPVEGFTDSDARFALEGQGFKILVVREFSDVIEEGVVIRQDPRAGTDWPRGDDVTIVVSRGPSSGPTPSPTPTETETEEPEPEPEPTTPIDLPTPGPTPSPTAAPDPEPEGAPSPVALRWSVPRPRPDHVP